MLKLKKQKHFSVIAGVALILLILGAIFNVNTYLMAALIGIFVSSLFQFFMKGKKNS